MSKTEIAEAKNGYLTRERDEDARQVGEGTFRERFVRPVFVTEQDQDAHRLQVHMPGVNRQGVDISLVEDQLEIIGRRQNTPPENWRPIFRESEDLDYRLRVRLNVRVDTDKIEAFVEDGMLTLTLPIQEEAKPRTIEVK